MREREIWDASVDSLFYAQHNDETFSIHAALDRDGRDIRVNITPDNKQTARWLAQSLLEWAGEE